MINLNKKYKNNSNQILKFESIKSKNTTQAFLLFSLLVSFCSTPLWAQSTSEKTITIARLEEPPNLDSSKATDAESIFVLGHIMEGLTRLDPDNKVIPAIAEKWTINEKTATFYLRNNAKWSDGSQVTAKDFVFAWKTVVDPKTASEYSFSLYTIKNAEDINKGKKPLSELGVKAINDTTLEVTFERPCGYFLSLIATPTYFPIKETFYKNQSGKYGANVENLISDGPYKLTKWVHGASYRFEKNNQYWNANHIQINTIDVPFITPDNGARFNLFKTGKIDILDLNKDNVQNAQRENFKLAKFVEGKFGYLTFNFRKGRVTNNKNLRKAILLVFNVNEYINKVVGIPGTNPGKGLIPSYMMGVKDKFRKEFVIPDNKVNLVEAKKLIENAKKELGGSIPPLVYLTDDTPLASKEAEYFQNLLKTTLGIDLKIDKQIFKQRLAKASAGDFDIVSEGWGPDYPDPMTFGDLFASWNDNNKGKWSNEKYDALIKIASGTFDQKIRMQAFADAEKILIEETPIVNTYERTIIYTTSNKVKGVVRRVFGSDPDYTYAHID